MSMQSVLVNCHEKDKLKIMTIWNALPKKFDRPAYRSLADWISAAIKRGDLAGGEKLPPHRDLSYKLAISVQTVSRAYDLLIRRGLVKGEVGRGTYVNARPVETSPPYLPHLIGDQLVDFSNLKPVTGQLHMNCMRRALSGLSSDISESALLSFRPATTLRPYMPAAVSWLERCGLTCSSDQIIMTNGSSSAMAIALMTAVDGSELIATDAVCHYPLSRLSQYMNFNLAGLPVDEEGILPAALDEMCRQKAVKTLFLLPNGLGPMALTMGLQRREQLVSLAQKYDLLIIENDAWGPLQPRRLPPIAALAPERTFYFTSFTKCLLPGLRHGYLVAPEAFASAASNRHLVMDWIATPFMAELAARWIEDGTAEELLFWQKTALKRRNMLAHELLEGVPFNKSPNGLHIWLPLPDGWGEDSFIEAARQKGIVVAPGSAFALPGAAAAPGVRICLGNMAEDQFIFGMQQLAALCHSKPEAEVFVL